jgi:hypothetical protein
MIADNGAFLLTKEKITKIGIFVLHFVTSVLVK